MTPEEQKLWDGIKDMPVGHARQLLFESCLKRDRLRAELAAKDEEIAELKAIIKDTPMIGRMAAVVFSVLEGEQPTDEQTEIRDWLSLRRKALGHE